MSTVQPSSTAIDSATAVGMLALTVADLAHSVEYYRDAVGFEVLQQDSARAVLGVGTQPLLVLDERAGAQPWPRGGHSYTGLYHFAILVPTQADLGRWLRHWLDSGLPVPGQGDHLVSEALYLEDPDGNGIEVYRDRPRSQWQWDAGQVRMGVDPVDLPALLEAGDRTGEPWSGLPVGTRIGHMHLQVGDIAQARAFYHDVLGFDIVAAMPTALFVSAGGYHHHIGMNIWHSRGASAAPDGTVGLRFFTLEFSDEEARQAVADRVQAAGLSAHQVGDLIVVPDPWNNLLGLRVGVVSSAAAADSVREAFASLDRREVGSPRS